MWRSSSTAWSTDDRPTDTSLLRLLDYADDDAAAGAAAAACLNSVSSLTACSVKPEIILSVGRVGGHGYSVRPRRFCVTSYRPFPVRQRTSPWLRRKHRIYHRHSSFLFIFLIYIHRVSKKLCQLIFCSLSVKYEPISIKIGRIVPEETLNEIVPKLSTSPKVCACTTLGNLKCQIEPSTQ